MRIARCASRHLQLATMSWSVVYQELWLLYMGYANDNSKASSPANLQQRQRTVELFKKHLTIEIYLKRKLTSVADFTKILTMAVSEIFLITLRVPQSTRK